MIVGLTWTGRALEPLDAQDLDVLRAAYGPGEIVSIDVKYSRNLKHHRKFFALLNAAVKMGCGIWIDGEYVRFDNKDALRAFAFVAIGWCDWYGGVPVPRTIKFDAVDQTRFTKIYEQAVLYLDDELDPPCQDIQAEAAELRAKGIEREDLREAA